MDNLSDVKSMLKLLIKTAKLYTSYQQQKSFQTTGHLGYTQNQQYLLLLLLKLFISIYLKKS